MRPVAAINRKIIGRAIATKGINIPRNEVSKSKYSWRKIENANNKVTKYSPYVKYFLIAYFS